MDKQENGVNNLLFVAPNGKLYIETKVFRKASREINGVSITELWRDAYALNREDTNTVLFPVEWVFEFGLPFDIVTHATDQRDYNGFIKGGGFRLDLNYDL